MLALAVRMGQHLGQKKTGGADRRRALFCSSCVYNNTMSLPSRQESPRHATGWFNHTRGTCNHRSYCKLAEDYDLCRMTEVQLSNRLIDVGLLGKEEQERRALQLDKEKKKAEEMTPSEAQSSGQVPRSVSVSQSEEPERKRRKEKKEKKTKES